MLLGALFFILQVVQWRQLWAAGLRLPLRRDGVAWDSSVAYAGCFYALTWLHAAHVLAAMGVLGWQAPGMWAMRFNLRDHLPVRFAVWFWHFVTVAWFGVWLLAYVL